MSRMNGVTSTNSDANRPMPGFVTISPITASDERLCLARRSDSLTSERSETSQRLTSVMQAKIEKRRLLGGDD